MPQKDARLPRASEEPAKCSQIITGHEAPAEGLEKHFKQGLPGD